MGRSRHRCRGQGVPPRLNRREEDLPIGVRRGTEAFIEIVHWGVEVVQIICWGVEIVQIIRRGGARRNRRFSSIETVRFWGRGAGFAIAIVDGRAFCTRRRAGGLEVLELGRAYGSRRLGHFLVRLVHLNILHIGTNTLGTYFIRIVQLRRIYAGVQHHTYRARSSRSLRYMRGIFSFFISLTELSLPCLWK